MLAALFAASSTGVIAAPAKPNIAWMPATIESGENILVHWDMWWGENGTDWQLLRNDALQCQGNLTPNGSNQQSAECTSDYTAGSHTLIVRLCNSDGCTDSNGVTIQVNQSGGGEDPNTPPTVSVTAPSSAVEGELVSLMAQASDSDGSVSSVAFLVNGESIDSDTSEPYSATWNAVVGEHQITALATDNDGAQTLSSASTIVVSGDENLPPELDIQALPNEIQEGDTVLLSASASDADGNVIAVRFYLDGQLLSSDTSARYEAEWTAVSGSHQLTVTAEDDALATTTQSVNFLVESEEVSGHEQCRPDGMVATAGVMTPYCDIYDIDGREKMGGATRRIIGYFTSWRTGGNGPAYLAHQIPWEHLTHINYAFAHVDASHRVSVGASVEGNAATDMEWPGVAGAEMDPAYPYTGHFNLLNKFKKQYPHVKTLISIGGWAETGGYFDAEGDRVATGGFYTMTTNADGSVNTTGIETFANSVVDFLREYNFDGADIDYEYPTSMNDAGNPEDFAIANARRAGLNASYNVLMRTLREKLDIASAQDGKYYMLTIASPSSGYLLRGMEAFDSAKYLDYVNIMSYDLHGAWNQFVGPNAALFDNGEDSELQQWNAYGGQYQNVGYLNTDWAYHYFRGSMPAGRINIGVPYYTRGWKGVSGGTNGLWGTAALPDQSQCPEGTGSGETNKCGYGATGIDNLWHDKNSLGDEMGAGSNPMWHAKNLEFGIRGSYLEAYGLNPDSNPEHAMTGDYVRYYDDIMVTPWLWNDTKKVFISTEDLESIETKANYVVDEGIGGIMFWELAGDFQYNSNTGEYEMGYAMTSKIAERFASAPAYGALKSERPMPSEQVDIRFELANFALGDNNFPITPDLILTNQSGQTIPGGSSFYFDIATSTPDNVADQSAAQLTVVESGANASGNNIGGLENNFHRVRITLPAYLDLADGEQWEVVLKYYLPASMPSNWEVEVGDERFALKQEYPNLPAGTLPSGGGETGGEPTGGSCSDANVNPDSYPEYPDFPHLDWAGEPDHAKQGDRMRHEGAVYEAKWWTNSEPGSSDWDLVCTY